ncbi:vWA domain-containing protein [Kordiimonas marina]|uniref:vWA domain-containing protein n=1 Tax=Kordiimonas marina TaxID=2872312 RepID=UPI001FF567AA|nr:vWA domain-containing protein [Kordiimonas marina]MCJ9430067.1 VWA domain-containing protein [Kordiimonas marina]
MASNYLIMLDTSGSMGETSCGGSATKINAAKSAIKSFFRHLAPGTNVGLYSFSSDVRKVMPLGRYTHEQFDTRIDRLSADGATPLRQALVTSEKVLRAQAQAQGGYGSYNLVLVTDGQSSDGKPGPVAKAIASDTAININVVGFCTGQDHSLNLPGYTRFSTADSADQLVQSLSKAVKPEQDVFDVSDFSDD